MSILILTGEVGYFADWKINLINKFVKVEQGFIVSNILVFFPLGYLCISIYFGLFSFKLTKWYDLYPNHTDS